MFFISCSEDGQVPDDSFGYRIENPAYVSGEGPIVLVDEGHNNFHKIGERYRPFRKILEHDGYIIRSTEARLTREILDRCDIFVISVPTSEDNKSAYTDGEIQAVNGWVKDGGSLLLITDHMPDPPAIAALAESFGITVYNGYVLNEDPDESVGSIVFRRDEGTLADHPIVNGRPGLKEEIDSVTSFTGCAFEADSNFMPLMIFGHYKTLWLTEEPDQFPDDTPQIQVLSWYQGGVMRYGGGRLAFFGEAGMFTAQIITKPNIKFGMNVGIAGQNPQFLLNIFHWLARII
jgi:hypothetical protein